MPGRADSPIAVYAQGDLRLAIGYGDDGKPNIILAAQSGHEASDVAAWAHVTGDFKVGSRAFHARPWPRPSVDKVVSEFGLLPRTGVLLVMDDHEATVFAREMREEYAKTAEDGYLKDGKEVEVKVKGDDQDVLSIKWFSCKRVFVYNLATDNATGPKLRELGFKRIECWDGMHLHEPITRDL